MNKRLLKKLQSKEYRNEFVAASITQGLAYQIRVMRESRGWDQKEFAKRLGLKSQSAVARIEDPSYGKLSFTTFKKIAKAFDVGALVKLVPYSRMLTEVDSVAEESLNVVSFEQELPKLTRSVNLLATIKVPLTASSPAGSKSQTFLTTTNSRSSIVKTSAGVFISESTLPEIKEYSDA